MIRTVKAIIDESGNVRLLEKVELSEQRQALVTILEGLVPNDTTVLDSNPARQAGNWKTLYHSLRLIGRGGMGETYLALDSRKQELVCVKCLHPSIDTRALLQECRALAKLSHPHIVKLVNFDTQGDSPYLVLEYVQGPTLADLLRQQRFLTEPVVVELGKQLFGAISHAHTLDILHCDLKPGNILLEGNSLQLQSKIVDFGLAVVDRRDDHDVLTAAGRSAGTPNYMAPEQFQGEELSGACDVYAVGQILWEALSGRIAFSGPPASILYEKMQRRSGLVIEESPWNVSTPLEDLIEACTHPNATQRPTAQQALDMLRPIDVEVHSPTVLTAANLSFDLPTSDNWPPGWFNSQGYVHGVSTDYGVSVIPRGEMSGGCVRLHKADAREGEFGSLMQRFFARHLIGKNLELRAEMRTENANRAGLWLRVDGHNGTLFFDNMNDRPIRGSSDWSNYILSVKIPPEAEWINYGILLIGNGTVWADNFSLSVQDEKQGAIPLSIPSNQNTHLDMPLT